MRARTWFLFWLGGTLGVLTYAWLDLQWHPSILEETHLVLTPDISKIPNLVHWGGRLLHLHPALLLMNAMLLGALITLVASFIVAKFQRKPKVEYVVGDEAPDTLRTPYSR